MVLWRNSEADRLLEKDMAENKHKAMLPSELRKTRPEYELQYTPFPAQTYISPFFSEAIEILLKLIFELILI